jgi:EmrB/QacA subfamily drug resistance transporter
VSRRTETDGPPVSSSRAAPGAVEADRPHSMTQTQVALFALGALVTLVLGILDQNIVATAALPIIKDLDPVRGLAHLPWLISVYALAATATQPLYGKLCDIVGPKPVHLVALSTFLVGSLLCGLARNMTELIAFRAVQGVGGGGLLGVTLVILARMFPPRQRARGAGLGGVLLALGTLSGPLVGGLLSQHVSWRWVFFVNLPLAACAIIITATALHLPGTGHRPRADLLGAALITAAASAGMVVASTGGTTYPWSSTTIRLLSAAAVVLLAAFIWRQLKAAEPLFPLSLLRRRTLGAVTAVSFLGAFAITGTFVYIVTFLQIARDMSPTRAGLFLLPTAVGVLVVSVMAGLLLSRFGRFRPLLVLNSALGVLALGLLGMLRVHTSSLTIGVDLFLLGCGLGGVLQIALLAAQKDAPEHELGVVTGAIRFSGSLGLALGTAVFGAILAARFTANVPRTLVRLVHGGTPDTAALRLLSPQVRYGVIHAYVSATDVVFMAAAGIMLSAFAAALLFTDTEPEAERASVVGRLAQGEAVVGES